MDCNTTTGGKVNDLLVFLRGKKSQVELFVSFITCAEDFLFGVLLAVVVGVVVL
jgi:hypothetical protein